MKHLIHLFIFLFSLQITNAQRTVGLLSLQKDKVYDGYTLLYPHNQPNVYLINNCGEVVHVWPDSTQWRPGNTAYLTPEGKLIKTKRNKTVVGNPIWFGGGGAIVEIRDWDNNLEWRYELNNDQERLHHDIKPMPNGNILMIVWQKKTKAEMAQAGRDTTRFKEAILHTESIIEVNPKTDQVVWRWNLWDHLVQQVDTAKANFGIIAASPGRVDINYPYFTDGSWYHMNAIDYHEELDQILVSVPTHNEIWIIDHSTTTAQAASSQGGLSGVGGDLMYRWGNPAVYGKGDIFGKNLGYQHGVHWVRHFIPPTHPNYGKINVFNNRAGANFSEVHLLSAPWDMYEWKYTRTSGAWGPALPDEVVRHPEKEKLFSDILSNAQFLANGNMQILSGRTGYLFELSASGQVVWEYKVPFKNGNAVVQGTPMMPNDNTTFRFIKYPVGYSAFQGRDLSIKGFIELDGDAAFCDKLSGVNSASNVGKINIYPNPASGQPVQIEAEQHYEATLLSADGLLVRKVHLVKGNNTLDTTDLPNGLYFLTVDGIVAKAFSVLK